MKLFKVRGTWILLCLLIPVIAGYSQSFLDTSSVWSLWYDATGEGGQNTGFRVKLEQPWDSAGWKISSIQISRNQNPEEWFPGFGRLREDINNNIWLNNNLLYDFSIQPGDTFLDKLCFSRDTVMLGGVSRIRWMFECLDTIWWSNDTADIWIEGIGSIRRGLFYSDFLFCPPPLGTPFTYLICYHHGNIPVFINQNFNSCLHSSTFLPPEHWPDGPDNKWYHDYEEPNPWGGTDLGNICIKSVSDAVVSGYPCRKYRCQTVNHMEEMVMDDYFYLRQEGSVVYYSFGGPFYVLFDLGAHPGDSWTTRNPYEIYGLAPEADSMTTYTVDSVYYSDAFWPSEIFYRNLVISSSSDWTFKMPVMEVTGGRWFFFPGRWDDWTGAHPGATRCFYVWNYEPPFIHYSYPCFFLSDEVENLDPANVSVRQTDDQIIITPGPLFSGNLTINLFDVLGRLVCNQNTAGESAVHIPASELKSGLYFIHLRAENGRTASLKVIRNW